MTVSSHKPIIKKIIVCNSILNLSFQHEKKWATYLVSSPTVNRKPKKHSDTHHALLTIEIIVLCGSVRLRTANPLRSVRELLLIGGRRGFAVLLKISCAYLQRT